MNRATTILQVITLVVWFWAILEATAGRLLQNTYPYLIMVAGLWVILAGIQGHIYYKQKQ